LKEDPAMLPILSIIKRDFNLVVHTLSEFKQ
jgi:hypothetical protein